MNITNYLPALCQLLVSRLPFPSSSLCGLALSSPFTCEEMEVKGLTPQHKSKYRFRFNSFCLQTLRLLQNYISLLALASGEEDKSGKKMK